MDKQKLIMTLAQTQEDQILLARVWDRISAGQRKNIPTATCFLTGREQILARQLIQRGGLEEAVFFGGPEGAERQVCVYIPDYYDREEFLRSDESPVAALHLTYSDYDSLNHRDFLGGLMAQGIKREILGDIFPGDHCCDLMVLREMADYLCRNLTQVGRARVTVTPIPLWELTLPEQKVKLISDTVASLRLDSILASGFQMGRSKAAALTSAGKVELNHMPATKPDAAVSEGDIISARGSGKMRVAKVKGETKKGRLAVVLERYL